jgi:hypothetical protein
LTHVAEVGARATVRCMKLLSILRAAMSYVIGIAEHVRGMRRRHDALANRVAAEWRAARVTYEDAARAELRAEVLPRTARRIVGLSLCGSPFCFCGGP